MRERDSQTRREPTWARTASFAGATIAAAAVTVGVGVDRFQKRHDAYDKLDNAQERFDASLKENNLTDNSIVRSDEIPPDVMVSGEQLANAENNVESIEEGFSSIMVLGAVGATIALGAYTGSLITEKRRK